MRRTQKWINRMVKGGYAEVEYGNPSRRGGSIQMRFSGRSGSSQRRMVWNIGKGSGKGKGWHGDKAGHARAARKRKK